MIKIIITIVIVIVFTNNYPTQHGGPRGGTHVVAWMVIGEFPLKSIYGASQARNDTHNNRKESLYAYKQTEHKEYILQTLFMHKNGKKLDTLTQF